MSRRPSRLSLLLLLWACSSCSAYVVSNSALPRHRQVQWLEQLTDTMCTTEPGALSTQELQQAPHLMYAWSQLHRPDGALRAESIMKRVIDEHKAGNTKASLPTLEDYNCLLEGWAHVSRSAGTAASERCESILMEMQSFPNMLPNLDSFKAVLMAWRHTDAPHSSFRAQRILEWMITLSNDGTNPGARPDADCFDICMQSWARSGHVDAPQKAEQLLGAMERLYEATESPKLRPRTTSFNAVLTAWSKSSDTKQASKRVLALLGFMEQLAKEPDATVVPDMVSYKMVVNTLTKTGQKSQAQTAVQLLGHVEETFKANAGSTVLEPDTIFYNTVIGFLAKTNNNSGAYRRARALLDRQINLYSEYGKAKPDVYGFTSVLGACAMETKQRYKAFQVALATFQQLRHSSEYGTPNHVTYGTMLKCCARLLPSSSPHRKKWTRQIWKQCVQDGRVGDMVLSRLREAASADLYKELMDGVDKRNLPEAWTVNVDEKRECRKQTNKKRKPGRRREV